MCEVQKGQYFRIIDLEGNQAVDTLFISAENPKSVTAQWILWPSTNRSILEKGTSSIVPTWVVKSP